MGSPREALPTGITTDAISAFLPTIDIPHPDSISILSTSAEYHIIAFLSYSSPNESKDLILRIAGSHIPTVKTENEVAVISWLQQNTTIPVPKVVAYDASTTNPLKHEYILQETVEDESLDKLWPSLPETEKFQVIDFVADVLRQLSEREFKHIGSLQRKDDGTFIPGSVLDERFWENRDISKYFPGETYASLNPLGPFESYVDFSIARLERYAHCIRIHESLEFMREYLGLIDEFTESLREDADSLNSTKMVLAHRDLHLGNITYSPTEHRVTAILDWEFSVVMPMQQGDVSRALFWPEPKDEMLEKMRKRGYGELLDRFEFASEDQKEMQEVVDLIRAIVEVSPRGQREVEKMEWMKRAVEIMRGWVEE